MTGKESQGGWAVTHLVSKQAGSELLCQPGRLRQSQDGHDRRLSYDLCIAWLIVMRLKTVDGLPGPGPVPGGTIAIIIIP